MNSYEILVTEYSPDEEALPRWWTVKFPTEQRARDCAEQINRKKSFDKQQFAEYLGAC